MTDLGGQIKAAQEFDATKGFKMSTADSFKVPVSLQKGEEDKYDPTKIGDMITFIK